MHQEEDSLISDTLKNLKEFFPGFTVIPIKNDQKQKNYVIQHKDKKIMHALSMQLAEDGLKIIGNTGKPKFVSDHLQNQNYSIVLTDKNYDQIMSHQALLRKQTNGSYTFTITPKELDQSLKINVDSLPSSGIISAQGRAPIAPTKSQMGKSTEIIPSKKVSGL